MSIDVIIVNYRSGDVLERCLLALRQQTVPHAVHIVDNNSADGSPRRIKEQFPEVSMLPLRRNTGFARAVNIAAGRSTADIIITLNPDTVPEPEFVQRITEPFNDSPALGSVASTLVFDTRPDIIASAGIQVHRNGVAIDALLGEHRRTTNEPVDVFGASGGGAAYRREVFSTLGGFAEPFFMYLEDVDLAWRMRLTGYHSVWSPAAIATHSYSASAVEGSPFKRRLLARNRLWTLVRCLPAPLWKRDGPRIASFDAAATAFGMATLDKELVSGRAAALAGILPRLVERDRIQGSIAVNMADIEPWILPALSPARMRRLRNLTARLATVPGKP